jgi:RHH-type rel operon transcriptional repressor/antitoxin RelB
MTSSVLTLRLPNADLARLNELAKTTHRPKSFYVKEALARYLEDLEDTFLAEQSLQEIRAGRSKTYTLEQVERELGLAD